MIFIHIQKTGGSSISAAFRGLANVPEKHFTAVQLRELYGQQAWNSYFKFSFVRNPWDRLVSWWAMIDGLRPQFDSGATLNGFQSFVLRSAKTFDEFLENCDEEVADTDGLKHIFRNQSDYLTDADGQLMVDFVGRFENFQQDFDRAVREMGLGSVMLPHINKSQHRHYTDYYTSALEKKVGRRFEKDIDRFGYVFGS